MDFEINKECQKTKAKQQFFKIMSAALKILSPILTYILLEFYIHNPFLSMYIRFHFLNLFFFLITLLILYGITGKLKTGEIIQTIVTLIYGLANFYVYNFRGTPILPWDIKSIGTALSVADNYSYIPSKRGIIVTLLLGLLIVLQVIFIDRNKKTGAENSKKVSPRNKWIFRGTVGLMGLIILTAFVGMVWNNNFVKKVGLYDKLFTPTAMLVRNGTALSFIMETEYFYVSAPEGYNQKEEAAIYSDFLAENQEKIKANTSTPNIIVIMDEAFSDLSVLGDFGVNEDYMPFIRSLMENGENTVSGYLNVSVLGGNTANTEYEFLTGNSMYSLPDGCIPYQQYINSEMPSLASLLKNLGYKTVAVHPYEKSGWNREKVYKYFSFDEFITQEDFENPEFIRNYISDDCDFKKLEEIYENKGDSPLFIFNVTIQNHSSYDKEFENFPPDISIEAAPLKATNTYLSLIKKTDEAFENLIEYFENVDEDTMIVFFGDHQPANNISNFIFKLKGENTLNLSAEEESLLYKVPFIIWTNFDTEEEQGLEISANYLAQYLLTHVNISSRLYPNVADEVENYFPVLNSQTQNTIDLGNLSETEMETLNEYEKMSYYLLFDY